MTRPSLSVTVDIVIFALRDDGLQVLLVKRKYPPFQGQWAIPGGYVETGEPLEAAAARELCEETGIGVGQRCVDDIGAGAARAGSNVPYIEQLYTFGAPDRDPRGRVITVAYLALVPAPLAVRAGSDAADAGWTSAHRLPKMAFDHADIVRYALQRLRYKLEYTAVGFQLLPPAFTLSGLQRAYEAVLGETLDKRNFRRRILQARVIEDTGRLQTGEGRPAKLYRFRDDAVAEVKARRLFP
jgi:8-oxo-dGTP diphosphatase